MNESNTATTVPPTLPTPMTMTPPEAARPIVDRRRAPADARVRSGFSERRQFGSSHAELSEAGRELALAIDQYKLEHHRRYITCDEMLLVLTELGYARHSTEAH
ncbi:MAG: hypothetical protein AAGD07_06255 [Planctomycetota bacterium]